MILTQTQADAVYSAMCALNNVGAHPRHMQIGKEIEVRCAGADRPVGVHKLSGGYYTVSAEKYANQAAYNLKN